MNVCAIIVTRGDVPLDRILESFPEEWDALVWNNGERSVRRRVAEHLLARIVTGRGELPDLSVYGRYAAIKYTDAELIYVQDDDCVVSDPARIVRSHDPEGKLVIYDGPESYVTCNMPQEFRHDFYDDNALVGFGAVFHRDAPTRAFKQLWEWEKAPPPRWTMDQFHRTCDVVFTGLTPRLLVDVPKENLPWADRPDRLWRQPTHIEERQRMRDLVKEVRKGGQL